MHSDLIGKIAKAQQYATEPERVVLDELQATFHGGNNNHLITLAQGAWTCDCSAFRMWQTCAHVMALQKLLEPMLSPVARAAGDTTGADHALMHSGLYGKIEKARQYANEPERAQIQTLKLRFRGGNNDHTMTLRAGCWACDCSFFRTWGTCAHVMALQKLFAPMLSPVARAASGPLTEEQMIGALG